MCPKFKRYRDPSQLPCADLPEGAVRFREPRNFLEMAVASVPFTILIAGLLSLCLRLKGASLDDVFSLPGAVLATGAVIPHELLHAVAFPKGSDVSFWYCLQAFFVHSTTPVSKRRFIFMCLLPAIVLGALPLLVWLVAAPPSGPLSAFLFTFSALGLLYGTGDYLNAFNAAAQMPPNAVTCLSGFHSYWYVPKGGEEKKGAG